LEVEEDIKNLANLAKNTEDIDLEDFMEEIGIPPPQQLRQHTLEVGVEPI